MRQQTENNISTQKRDFQNNYRERSRHTLENQSEPMLIAVSELNRAPVRYFDLVANTNASVSVKPEKFQERKFAAERSKKFCLRASPNADAKELFDVLLFQFDQIVYLNEMRASLEKLESAVAAGNSVETNSIASDCASLSLNCGIFAALAPLRRLERLENTKRPADAANLLKRVKKEFELFRLNLKGSLAQMSRRQQIQQAN